MWQILRSNPAALYWALGLHLLFALLFLVGLDSLDSPDHSRRASGVVKASIQPGAALDGYLAGIEVGKSAAVTAGDAKPASQLEAQRQAQERAQQAAERAAQLEAQRRAEEQARREVAEREAQRQAQERAQQAAERAVQLEAQRRAEEQARREAAEREAQRQAQERAQQAAERAVQLEAQRRAEEQARREVAEREAQRQAQERAQQAAERAARLEAQRRAEEQARREAAEREAQRQAQERAQQEAERAARLEAQRQAEEQARREADLMAQLEAEESALAGGVSARQLNDIQRLVGNQIERAWLRPPGTASSALAVVLRAEVLPGGMVRSGSVRVAHSSGNEAFDQSAIAAMYNASPLRFPAGTPAAVLRSLTIEFSPGD